MSSTKGVDVDEGRRNFLTYQITSGIKFYTINDIRYKLIASSKEIRLLAEHIYQDTLHTLRFDNLITKERSKMLLLGLGVWGPNDDASLKKTEKYLEDKKISLYKALYNLEKQKQIRKTIKTIKNSINKLYARKHSLDYMTLDYHAFLTKRKYIIGMCLRDSQDKPIYSEDGFWTSNSTILEGVVEKLDSDLISIEEFRELARNDPWRSIWHMGKEACMGMAIIDWTDDQKTLVTFSKMYDGAYQSMECPSDEVFEDDDMFDGWLIDQRRTREKEQKQKEVDSTKNVPDSAQEVFVFAPDRESADQVYDLNDQTARMKIKQRYQSIEQHGSIEAKHLPDTQLELRNQAREEFKDKMHRGRR